MANVEQNYEEGNTTPSRPIDAIPAEQPSPKDSTKVLMSFEEPYYTYLQALQDVWRNSYRQVEKVNNDYSRGLQDMWADVQKRSEEAYSKYMTALQGAMGIENAQASYEDAYSNYLRDLQNAWGPADYLRWSEAYQDYVRKLQQAWEPEAVQKGYEEAFRAYISSLQKTWMQIDANTIDAASLARISQSMATAAYSAANTQVAGYGY